MKNESSPDAEMFAVTAFAIGPSPAAQFKLDVCGRVAPPGYTVRYDAALWLATVTFITSVVASAGIVHRPFLPRTLVVWTSFAPNGTARGPTVFGAGRVSIRRHGVVATNIAGSLALLAASAWIIPPAPSVTATAAPRAAHRDLPRCRWRPAVVVVVVMLVSFFWVGGEQTAPTIRVAVHRSPQLLIS